MQGKTVPGFDKLINFTEVIVSTGYDASATTIDLQAGEGAKLPDPAVVGSYWGMWYDVTANLLASEDANREWVLLTGLSSDQITIVRGEQETSASTKNELGHQYRIALVLSAEQLEKYNNLQNNGMSRQALVNSNFNIWGNGTSFVDPVNESTTADKWKAGVGYVSGTFPTVTLSRQAITPGDVLGSFYNYRINTNGAGSGFHVNEYYAIYQDIINGVRFLAGEGKKVTVSFYAKSSIASKRIGINLQQWYGTGGSPSSTEIITGDNITLTSNWKFYSFTYTLNTIVGKTFGTNNDDFIRVVFWNMWQSASQSQMGASSTESFGGSGNVEFAQVQVCSGDVALEYKAKSSAYEYSEMYGTSLFDGSDVLTHYHSTDRNRANHTGTQALSTIADTGTAGEIFAVNDLVYFKSSDSKYWKAVDGTNSWNATHVVYTGGIANATVTLLPLTGRLTLASNLTANTTYYRSSTGTLTSTRPNMSSASIIPLLIGTTDSAGNLVCNKQRLQRFITASFSGTGDKTITVGFPFSHAHIMLGMYDATGMSFAGHGWFNALDNTQATFTDAGLSTSYCAFAGRTGGLGFRYVASVSGSNLLLTYSNTGSTPTSPSGGAIVYEAL